MSTHHYHVHVFGQLFHLTSEKSEDFVRTVAAYVDRKMRERATASHTLVPLRVAIMTALGIAEELLEKNAAG
jgi:cell division protein ZapA